jgi:hypothetical protein
MTEPRRPIDLPDDFGTDASAGDRSAVTWAAAALVAVLVIAIIVLWGAFA